MESISTDCAKKGTNDNEIEATVANAGMIVTIEMPEKSNWLKILQTGNQGGALFVMSACFKSVGDSGKKDESKEEKEESEVKKPKKPCMKKKKDIGMLFFRIIITISFMRKTLVKSSIIVNK